MRHLASQDPTKESPKWPKMGLKLGYGCWCGGFYLNLRHETKK